MQRDELAFWLTAGSSACWLVCFWWMHSISSKQNALLAQLKEQAKRIERLAKDEHDLLQGVEPQINDIQEKVDKVAAKGEQR